MANAGMVVTIDIGGAGIHPANKICVGLQLARWALARNFGQRITYSGPMFERQEIQGHKLVRHYRYADNGLLVAAKERTFRAT
jgi:hypothetical protein